MRHALDRLEAADRERVRLVGHVDEVGDLLAAADVFVFPSMHEGLGGALLEALAMSLPIVASDLPAFREFLVPERNAILVPPGCAAAFAEAVVRLLSDDSLRRRMAAANLELFEQRFQMDTVARETEHLYRRLAASRSGTADRITEFGRGRAVRSDEVAVATREPIRLRAADRRRGPPRRESRGTG